MAFSVHSIAINCKLVLCIFYITCWLFTHVGVVQWALPEEGSARCRGIKYSHRWSGLSDGTSRCFYSPAESCAAGRSDWSVCANTVYFHSAGTSGQPAEIPRGWTVNCNTHVWWGVWWQLLLAFPNFCLKCSKCCKLALTGSSYHCSQMRSLLETHQSPRLRDEHVGPVHDTCLSMGHVNAEK